ncbi:MAG: phytanoyl-CoA dioxygenase family protein, partial [Gammaproteobacteria bacterium]|nr:phytanoyl-CoA dioxygenase family protein [Gammaproteobacteria bacterium]
LSLCDGWLKGQGEARTGIHCDWAQFEMPTFPPEPYTANFNYLLSDYSKDDGALGFVPGSHRWRRWPSPEEAEYWGDRCHPVEAPMGSMIIWGDHTWHGSFPRKTDGLRLMMLGTYCRPHMQTQEPFRQTVTQEALDRNPLRFGRLMDVQGAFPFGKSPPRPEKRKGAAPPGGYLSLMDDQPAAGSIRLRPHRDFDDYDLEFHAALAEKARGSKIDFPDLYRARPGR